MMYIRNMIIIILFVYACNCIRMHGMWICVAATQFCAASPCGLKVLGPHLDSGKATLEPPDYSKQYVRDLDSEPSHTRNWYRGQNHNMSTAALTTRTRTGTVARTREKVSTTKAQPASATAARAMATSAAAVKHGKTLVARLIC